MRVLIKPSEWGTSDELEIGLPPIGGVADPSREWDPITVCLYAIQKLLKGTGLKIPTKIGEVVEFELTAKKVKRTVGAKKGIKVKK